MQCVLVIGVDVPAFSGCFLLDFARFIIIIIIIIIIISGGGGGY